MADISKLDLCQAMQLHLKGKISQDNTTRDDLLVFPNQPCPKCNGEGYIVVSVYPWDGCSYDEKPCDLCNPNLGDFDFDDSGGVNAR